MTNSNELLKSLAVHLENSKVGYDNALTEEEGADLAKEILGEFLVMEKSGLPEATQMDLMIYAGSQAVHANSKPEDVFEKALAYLAAAAKLTEIKAAEDAERVKEETELLAIFNEMVPATKKISEYPHLTVGEKAAVREIKRLRLEIEAGRNVKVIHGGFAVND